MPTKKPTPRRWSVNHKAMLALLRESLPSALPEGLRLRILRLERQARNRRFVVTLRARLGDATRYMVHPISWRDLKVSPTAALHDFRRGAEQLVAETGLEPITTTLTAAIGANPRLYIGQRFDLIKLDRRNGELTLKLV